MKLRLLIDRPPTNPTVYVSVDASDHTAVYIVLHIDDKEINVAWISHRGLIEMIYLDSFEQAALTNAGFQIENRCLKFKL